MKGLKILSLAGVLVCGVVSGAWAASLDGSRSSVMFSGKSTLHDFHGTVTQFSGELNDGKGFFKAKVGSMDTQNPKRDKKMMKMFTEQLYPEIHYLIQKHTPLANGNVRWEGELMIRNVTKPLVLEAEKVQQGNFVIYEGSFDIDLNDFDLKPPSVLGLVRVDDQVSVEYELVFPLAEGQVL